MIDFPKKNGQKLKKNLKLLFLKGGVLDLLIKVKKIYLNL